MKEVKIIQLLNMPTTIKWGGRLLGLGDDGITYELSDEIRWVRLIPRANYVG